MFSSMVAKPSGHQLLVEEILPGHYEKTKLTVKVAKYGNRSSYSEPTSLGTQQFLQELLLEAWVLPAASLLWELCR